MAYERADAITIRHADFSETSRVYTFYTREFGRITALGKGALRKSSRVAGHVDLLVHAEIIFVSRRSREGMHILAEAAADEVFPHIRRELPRYYAACHAVALTEHMTPADDPNPPLFEELLLVLRRLNSEVSAAVALFAFEARLLVLSGFMPQLAQCVVCGKAPRLKRVAFSSAHGGIVCADCAPGQPDLIEKLSMGALSLLDRLARGRTTRLDRITISSQAARQMRSFLNQYESYTLGKELRTMKML